MGERRVSLFDDRSGREAADAVSAGDDVDVCNRDDACPAAPLAAAGAAVTDSSERRLDDDALCDNPSAEAAFKEAGLRGVPRRGVDTVRAEPLRDNVDAEEAADDRGR